MLVSKVTHKTSGVHDVPNHQEYSHQSHSKHHKFQPFRARGPVDIHDGICALHPTAATAERLVVKVANEELRGEGGIDDDGD